MMNNGKKPSESKSSKNKDKQQNSQAQKSNQKKHSQDNKQNDKNDQQSRNNSPKKGSQRNSIVNAQQVVQVLENKDHKSKDKQNKTHTGSNQDSQQQKTPHGHPHDIDDCEDFYGRFWNPLVSFMKRFGLRTKVSPKLKFLTMYQWREMNRNKFQLGLSFCSIFVIVLSTLLVSSSIEKTPVAFFNFAQTNHGEIDAIITPGQSGPSQGTEKQYFLNYTAITEGLSNFKYQLSPRKTFCGTEIRKHNPENQANNMQLQSHNINNGFDQHNNENLTDIDLAKQNIMDESLRHFTCLALIDTDKERQIRIGINYELPKMKRGECYFHQQQLDDLGAKIGDTLELDIMIEQLYLEFIKLYNKHADYYALPKMQNVQMTSRTQVKCKVMHAIQKQTLKFSKQFDKMTSMMEYDQFMGLILDNLPQELKDNALFLRFLKQRKIRLEDYADHLVMSLPTPRNRWYTKRSFDETQYIVTHYFNKFIDRVGFYSVSVDCKLLLEISKISRNNVLLTLLFDFVLLMFIVISTLLIHSLIMIRIETRSLETAVARMNGLNKHDLIKMMIISCSFFVVPAVILAFICSYPLLGLLYSAVLKEKLQDDFLPIPSRQAVALALFVSLIVPFLSAIMPIKQQLAKNLADALRFDRSKVQSHSYSVEENSKAEMIQKTCFGILTTGYGFIVYYFMPLAMISDDLGMLLRIFSFLLFCLGVGLCLLSMNLERSLETFLVWSFFWEPESFKRLLKNNLRAHMSRNKLTTLIYSFAFAFIMFVMFTVNTQIDTHQNHVQLRNGQFPSFESLGSKTAIDVEKIDDALMKHKDIIESFSYVPYDSTQYPGSNDKEIKVTDESRQIEFEAKLFGMMPNFFKTTEKKFYEIFRNNSGLDITEQLYSARGSQGAIVGTLVGQLAGQNSHKIEQLKTIVINKFQQKFKQSIKIRPIIQLNQGPLLKFTDRFPLENLYFHSVLMSLPMLAHHVGIRIKDIPFERLIVKLKSGIDIKEEQKIFKEIKNNLPPHEFNQIKFESMDRSHAQVLKDIMQNVFNMIIFLTLALSFLSLSSSMTSNIYEQSKEIGTLRAMGLKQSRLIQLYVYESYILAVSSSLLGVMIGFTMSYTLNCQFKILTGIPTASYYPTYQVLIIALSSTVCAIISTYRPVKKMTDLEISDILRMA